MVVHISWDNKRVAVGRPQGDIYTRGCNSNFAGKTRYTGALACWCYNNKSTSMTGCSATSEGDPRTDADGRMLRTICPSLTLRNRRSCRRSARTLPRGPRRGRNGPEPSAKAFDRHMVGDHCGQHLHNGKTECKWMTPTSMTRSCHPRAARITSDTIGSRIVNVAWRPQHHRSEPLCSIGVAVVEGGRPRSAYILFVAREIQVLRLIVGFGDVAIQRNRARLVAMKNGRRTYAQDARLAGYFFRRG
jgi:hypothetical protein